ncbi:MAG: tetratricopeptide repeat protein [bacterium]
MQRRLFHFLENNFMRFFRLLSHVIPSSWVVPLGRTVGLLLCTLAAPLKRRVTAQLRETFPEKSPREIRRLFRQVARNGGEVIFEQLMVSRKLILDNHEKTEGFEDLERMYRELSSRGRGLLVVASHLSNWEKLMGIEAHHLLQKKNVQVNVVMNRMPTSYLDGLATVLRHKVLKCNFIYTKRARYYIEKILAEKGLVAFATDVDYRYRGLFVPFMGRKISMGRGPATYALKHGAPLVFNMFYRDEKGTPHILLEEIRPVRTGDMERDVYNLTAEIASRIERWVRKYPDQWFGWLQQPWKTRSLEDLQGQLETDPRNARLLEEIGLFHLAKEEREKARESFREAIVVDPGAFRAHSELGCILSRDGDSDAGLFHLFRALEIHPKDVKTLKYLGHCFLERKLYGTALRYFRLAARVKYDDPEAYWGAGQCLEALGRSGKAAAAYRKGLRIDDDYAPLHRALVRFHADGKGSGKELRRHLFALETLGARAGSEGQVRRFTRPAA